jgi:hypothetical protein
VVENITTTYNKGIKKSIQINNYFIDLDTTILEYINLRTRDYITDIIDDIPSNFVSITDDEEFNIYLTDTFEDEPNNPNVFEEE